MCILSMAAPLVGFLGVSIMRVDLGGLVKKNRVTSSFGLQLMIGGFICVSGPCI